MSRGMRAIEAGYCVCQGGDLTKRGRFVVEIDDYPGTIVELSDPVCFSVRGVLERESGLAGDGAPTDRFWPVAIGRGFAPTLAGPLGVSI